MNTVKLVGTIGNDPLVKYNNKGTCMAMISIAENKEVNGQKVVKWHSVRAVGKLAEELGNSVGKASNVSIKGVYDNYRDESGKTVSYVRVTSYEVLERGKIQSTNEVMLSGVLGKEPTIRQNKNGTLSTWLSIAENREIDGQQVTKWHNVCAVGKIVESIEANIRTGQLVQFRGVYDNYQEKESKKIVSFVRAIEYKIIEKKKEQEQVQEKDNENVPDKSKKVKKEKVNIAEKPKTASKARKSKGSSLKETLEKEQTQEKENER